MTDPRRSYDAVAERYAAEFSAELDAKPVDRALFHALAELAGDGPVVDIGAGPGHVARYFRRRGVTSFALDLSPKMCALAHRSSDVPAVAGDMTTLPFAPASIGAIVCMYSVIHLKVTERPDAYSEFTRILRPSGHLLLSFHVSDDETAPGGERSVREWWGHEVHLVFRFLDPTEELVALRAGLQFRAKIDRAPYAGSAAALGGASNKAGALSGGRVNGVRDATASDGASGGGSGTAS